MKKLSLILSVIVAGNVWCASAYAGSLEKYFAQAQKAYKENRLEEAASSFDKVADLLQKRKQPQQAGLILGNVAGIRIKQEKYQEAIDIYTRALKISERVDPKFKAKVFTNLAFCYYKLGEHAQRASYLHKLLDEKLVTDLQQQANIFSLLGDSYNELECYSTALGWYEKAAKSFSPDSPSLGRLYARWAMCSGNLGDFQRAESLFKKAQNLGDPADKQNSAEIFSNLGILKWEQGEYAAASEFISKAIEIESRSRLRRNEGLDFNNFGLIQKSAGLYDNALISFENSLAIAREVKNIKDEAIALSNIALVKRIKGEYSLARQQYAEALGLYRQCGFMEGMASTLLGQGKLYEIADLDYAKALECYKEARSYYEELEMRRGVAESLNQIGRVLKKAANPKHVARDLVFSDDTPVLPDVEASQARAESREAYAAALEIASSIGSRELVWTAHQGLGNAFREEGKFQEAFNEYEKAVNIVTGLRGADSDVELLGEYLKDKRDLFAEAMEICHQLYKQTGDKKFMVRAMELDEILRNEVVKANAALIRLNYAEPEKRCLYNELLDNIRRKNKAVSNAVAADASSTASKEAAADKERIQKLDVAFEELLAKWKAQYPEDAVLFDSNARIDVDVVRANLADDEIVLNYVGLQEALIIIAITKESVNIYTSPVPVAVLDDKIKNNFLVDIIEDYRNVDTPEKEDDAMHKSTAFFHEMYQIVMKPVEEDIKNKKRLVIVASGFLAQLPFMALVTDASDPVNPRYLAEDKEVLLSRLAFFEGKGSDGRMVDQASMLAAGNPRNRFAELLAPLPAAEEEVRKAASLFGVASGADSVKYRYDATETWFKDTLSRGGYDILYMATHGMPFSDTFSFWQQIEKIKAKGKKVSAETSAQYDYMVGNLPGRSMLNGYIYMAASEKDDGFLTLKEIMELPASSFRDSRIVILSACNTGVTFAPKALKHKAIYEALTSEEVERELRKAGWVPGVDQVSFVDTFMKRGVDYAFGTLWFADDMAVGYILSEFVRNMKSEPITSAYHSTIRQYLKDSREERNPLGVHYTTTPQHPYFWAVGAVFGH